MTHNKIYNIGRPLKKQQIIPPPQLQVRFIHYYGLYIEIADYGCHKIWQNTWAAVWDLAV